MITLTKDGGSKTLDPISPLIEKLKADGWVEAKKPAPKKTKEVKETKAKTKK
jgi:hypothetical protein